MKNIKQWAAILFVIGAIEIIFYAVCDYFLVHKPHWSRRQRIGGELGDQFWSPGGFNAELFQSLNVILSGLILGLIGALIFKNIKQK